MKKTLLLLWTCTALCSAATAQQITTQADDSKSEDIIKTRRILLDRFIANNKIGITLVKEQLVALDDTNYIAIYPAEFWLLSYWTGDYIPILNTIKGMDSLKEGKIRIPPPPDYLAVKLAEKVTEQEARLLKDIATANLPEEQKAFLTMHLKYLLAGGETRQQELNNLADQFISAYPNSSYRSFTQSFIRLKYTLTASGSAVSFHSGQFRLGGALTNYYNHLTAFGLSLDLVHNNWLGQVDLAFGMGHTQTDMPLNNGATWPKNAKVTGGYLAVTIGRYIANSNIISIAPIAGIGVFGVDPNENVKEHPKLKDAGIKTSVAGSLGFISDIRLKKINLTKQVYYQESTQAPFIRIGYEYIASPLKNKFIRYSGSVHKLTLGIGILSRRVKRVH
ncbi:hypothetical protein [Niabella drilacis]|uniref:Outer membrane protein beta-barrel domain-containing protein n=1 Tax=Niabella drilacis (strain DSM 25811 / CCM 8410 / CCUG 62505 / LMG 26954 / E90) TaxID=1285928 RepID=A0A1G6IS72_NIADE|nr:hypothetical protein [Niabella drilacis]SDC09357.1 hypothetical protein SAMN04487894_101313 [Niabella drilacis]